MRPSSGFASDNTLPGEAAIFFAYALEATSQLTSSTGLAASGAAAEPLPGVGAALPDDALSFLLHPTNTITTSARFFIRARYRAALRRLLVGDVDTATV